MSGCNSVISPGPFGLTPIQLSPNIFENVIWSVEQSDDLRIKVLDPTSGKIEISRRGSDDPTNPKWETDPAYLMEGLHHHHYAYISTPCSADGSGSNSLEGYYFVLIATEPSRAIVWLPDHKKFKKHILNGTIKGQIVGGGIVLEKPTKEFFDYIESGDHGLFFDWKNPIIIKKTKKSEPIK